MGIFSSPFTSSTEKKKKERGEKKLQRTLELCGNGGKCGYKERLVRKNGNENNFKINKKKKKKWERSVNHGGWFQDSVQVNLLADRNTFFFFFFSFFLPFF